LCGPEQAKQIIAHPKAASAMRPGQFLKIWGGSLGILNTIGTFAQVISQAN
jgi:hypothetical protein